MLYFEKKLHNPSSDYPKAQSDPYSTEYRVTNDEGIIIPSGFLHGIYSDYNKPLFHGLFHSEQQLKATMKVFGGHGSIQIVSQETANRYFKRAGGGFFETGLFIPHPKNNKLLLPIKKYDDEIKQEVKAEICEILALLRAKKVLYAQKSSHEVIGKIKNINPTGSYKTKLEAQYGKKNVIERTFHKSTFNPKLALKDRLWFGDNRDLVALVNNLIQSEPKSSKMSSTINIAIEGSLEMISLATLSKTNASLKYKGELE